MENMNEKPRMAEEKKTVYYLSLLQNAFIAGRLNDVYQKEKQVLLDRISKEGIEMDGRSNAVAIREDIDRLDASYRYFRSPVFTVISKKIEELNKQIAALSAKNDSFRQELDNIKLQISSLKKNSAGNGWNYGSEIPPGYGYADGRTHLGFGSGISPDDIEALDSQGIAPGFVFQLGIYPYERDGRMSPIEWIVLEIYEDNTALVISKYCLDAKPFNSEYEEVSWEGSSLRSWLNGTFYNMAFSAREQSAILDSDIGRKIPPAGLARSQEAKEKYAGDKLFILDSSEAEKYFSGDSARRAKPTPYAVQKGAYISGAAGWWWLRSMGHNSHYAAAVNLEGAIYLHGMRVNSETEAVRVAMNVNLNEI